MNNVIAIALTTYRESIRSKVLYTVLFFAVCLVLISALFGTVTVGDQIKVIKDFGLMSISFFAVVLAVISGASLLHKELHRKTVYNILGKAVHRWQFLLGKQLGMLATIIVMVSLMGLGLLLFVYLCSGELDWRIFEACLYIVLELCIVTAAAILFSTVVVTTTLSGLFTFSAFVAGRLSYYIPTMIAQNQMEGPSANILHCAYWLLPHLDKLAVNDKIVYGISLPWQHLFWSITYSIGYSAALMILASLAFGRREFN